MGNTWKEMGDYVYIILQPSLQCMDAMSIMIDRIIMHDVNAQNIIHGHEDYPNPIFSLKT